MLKCIEKSLRGLIKIVHGFSDWAKSVNGYAFQYPPRLMNNFATKCIILYLTRDNITSRRIDRTSSLSISYSCLTSQCNISSGNCVTLSNVCSISCDANWRSAFDSKGCASTRKMYSSFQAPSASWQKRINI